MRKGQNYNHPKKGDSITVEPIRKTKDIQTIKKLLEDNPRNYCLFILGVNTNLRASDLLNIKVHQVRGLKVGDNLILKEKKTNKPRRITLNKAVIRAIERLLASETFNEGDSLFKGRKGALTVPSVTRLVKTWCKTINLKGNYGGHTLRKTFGYHQRVNFGVGLPELMVCFNHSCQKQTLDYLGIQADEIRDVFMNEI